jgi:adenine deaminase
LQKYHFTKKIKSISGNIVDVIGGEIFAGTIEIKNGKIFKLTKNNEKFNNFIIPGFIDSHIHIESSMLTPAEFARAVVINGTVAVVSDPHEIANVLGVKGIDYMIKNGKKVPFKFYFGAPSCVPATNFETSGAFIGPLEIKKLLKREEIKYLGEMMDFPGVISRNKHVIAKINIAKHYKKPIDGHAPGLTGEDLGKYVKAGISTDHEAYTKEEALEKIKLGMKILIREGSAAKDFDALSSLIEEYPDFCMFSSDDKHPNDLVEGHINLLVKKALALGYDKMKVLKCACVNPIKHYNLDVGLLQLGDKADFIEIDNFENLNVLKTVINGNLVSDKGWSLISKKKTNHINNFKTKSKKEEDFAVKYTGKKINVIEAIDGQLITKKLEIEPKIENGLVVSDIERDILKIAVVNRYKNSAPAVAFIKNFGFAKGAIASSVAHDSHNIIAVGVSDEDLTKAVNLVIKHKGGLCVVFDKTQKILPLPVAGLMTNKGVFKVAKEYNKIEEEVKKISSKLTDPFMTLSFMALLVIPEIKLSDGGLFDVRKFEFINPQYKV